MLNINNIQHDVMLPLDRLFQYIILRPIICFEFLHYSSVSCLNAEYSIIIFLIQADVDPTIQHANVAL